MNAVVPVPSEDYERERLRLLHAYGVLDSPADPVFDELAALAAKLCDAPISLISLVNEHRLWFKSHYGLSTTEIPRSLSFCNYSVQDPDNLTIIRDARADPRFADNPLVVSGPKMRYYAAAPLRTPEGYALGTLCVIDRKPRDLTPDQLASLELLSRQAMSHLELRRTLQALRRSEERFHSVARAVSDVIWDWDIDRQRLWWSESYYTVFGYPGGETPRALDSWASFIHPDDRKRVLSGLHNAIASDRATWRDEYRFRRGDGSYAIVQDRGEIMRHADGRAYRMCGGLTDLTELRHLEMQSLRAQRMESVGALASGIAHDLNNTLTPVLMSASILKKDLADRPAEQQLVCMIESCTLRAADLLRQILSFARGGKGTHSHTNVRSILTDVADFAAQTFPRAIVIEPRIADDLRLVRGNATQLHQVFVNLLVNARDAMPHGGHLAIVAQNVQLRDEACAPFKRQGGSYIQVTVRDTGTGMTPDVQERAFEPFFTTKPHGAGSGLGLSTVHGIVANHGGFVQLTSTAGTGTSFEVYLPAEQQVAPENPRPVPAPATKGRGELILLVDDEEVIRTVARQILTEHGYHVLLAKNGAEALASFKARQAEIQLVLMDLMMPVMDGVACIAELIKQKPDVRIVAVSGGMRPGSVRPLPPGIVVLPKPYLTESLLEIVRQTLDKPAHPTAS